MPALKLPRQRDILAQTGGKPEEWAGSCHGLSMIVAELMGPEVATVRRGYFIGEKAPGAHFFGVACQHSWVELRDGRVLDPTHFAFVGGKPWPLWIGTDEDYDIGGCKSVAAYGQAPATSETRSPGDYTTVEIERRAIWSTGLDFCMDGDRLTDTTAELTHEQVFWLGNLPVKDAMGLGQLSREFAPTVYRALMAAGRTEAIPIDRRDWIVPELSEGRSSF